MLFLLSAHFFQKILSGTLSESNGLDSDQDGRSVRPDLGPNCLQRLSAYPECTQSVQCTPADNARKRAPGSI